MPYALALLLLAPALAGAGGAAWVAPLAGPLVVARAFAPPPAPWAAGHRGVDLRSSPGAVVRSAGAGVVSYAGVLAGRGVVAVTHGALRTTYEPVRLAVRTGAPVRAGDAIGWVVPGHAVSGEAVLHWGLLRGGTYLDPQSLLARGPSRLVPVSPAAPPEPVAVPVPPGSGWAPPPPSSARSRAPSPLAAHTSAVAFEMTGVSLAGLALAAALRGRRVSRAGRRACRGAGGPPSCASGRSGSRSRPGPGRSPPG